MNAAVRRGACPTLAAPMQTGDGLLARLNPVAAGLSPAELVGLCEAALRHGNGIVEVTARGSFQIRGLSAASAELLAAEVDGLGIAVRSGVPVETGPLAGLDPTGVADPRPLAEAIRAAIDAAWLEGRLGPKVSVVVDGGGAWLGEVKADVRLTALGGDRWRLAVGGNAATARLVGSFAGDNAATAAIALLGEVAVLGRQGRASALAIEALTRAVANLEYAVERGRAESHSHPTHALRLTDGRFAVPVALPFGHVRAETLIELARAADGATEIRLAPKRTILLLVPTQAAAHHAREAAHRLGFVVDASDPRARIAACTGSPACASGHMPARAIATDIAASMPANAALDLHVSGCAKRCAKPGHDGLTLVGRPEGVALVLGRDDAAPLAHIAHEHGAAALRRVVQLIAAERNRGEADAACLSRIGRRRLAETFAGTEMSKEHR